MSWMCFWKLTLSLLYLSLGGPPLNKISSAGTTFAVETAAGEELAFLGTLLYLTNWTCFVVVPPPGRNLCLSGSLSGLLNLACFPSSHAFLETAPLETTDDGRLEMLSSRMGSQVRTALEEGKVG